jgi:hypothetical protein
MSTVIFLKKNYSIFFINHIFKFFGKKITHAIKRYIRIGCELTSGNDIEKAIEGLSGTSVAQIEPNRDKNNNEHNTNNTISKKQWYEMLIIIKSVNTFLLYIILILSYRYLSNIAIQMIKKLKPFPVFPNGSYGIGQ